ncbi:hypothetical protein H5410_038665, partial [Solanum commersonii]
TVDSTNSSRWFSSGDTTGKFSSLSLSDFLALAISISLRKSSISDTFY